MRRVGCCMGSARIAVLRSERACNRLPPRRGCRIPWFRMPRECWPRAGSYVFVAMAQPKPPHMKFWNLGGAAKAYADIHVRRPQIGVAQKPQCCRAKRPYHWEAATITRQEFQRTRGHYWKPK